MFCVQSCESASCGINLEDTIKRGCKLESKYAPCYQEVLFGYIQISVAREMCFVWKNTCLSN
jgi:hypothetical protein